MATNPDSIERDPTPIKVVLEKAIVKAKGWSQRALFAATAAIVASGVSPLDAIGAALIVLVIYEVTK
jgi:hypothetical protein